MRFCGVLKIYACKTYGVGVLVGVSVGVEVNVGVKVGVTVDVVVGVKVSVGVSVIVGVGVFVAVGAVPCRTMCGFNQMAKSWLFPPFALTTKMNFSVCPARLLRSKSTG